MTLIEQIVKSMCDDMDRFLSDFTAKREEERKKMAAIDAEINAGLSRLQAGFDMEGGAA